MCMKMRRLLCADGVARHGGEPHRCASEDNTLRVKENARRGVGRETWYTRNSRKVLSRARSGSLPMWTITCPPPPISRGF